MLEHGANRDLRACGSPGPSRRDRVRGRVGSGVPRRRSRRRRQPLVERVPGSRERLSVGDPTRLRRPAAQTRAVACLVNWARAQDRRGRLVRRPALQRAAALKGERVASCGQFSHTPCGSAVTAAVRRVRLPLRDASARTSSPERGDRSPRVTSWRRGSSPRRTARTCSTARFRDVGAAPVRAHGLLDGGGCRRVDGHVRLSPLSGQDSSRQPGMSGRARGEPTRRHALRHSRRLRATRGASWRAGAAARAEATARAGRRAA